MAKNKDIQRGGIVFGDWKLMPLDERNWELCHRHATPDNARTRAAGSVGRVRWHRCGRYYQAGTFHLAIRYAADAELRAGCRDRAEGLSDALDRYERVVGDMVAALLPQAPGVRRDG